MREGVKAGAARVATVVTGPAAYSASIPAALITLPHFWVSVAWNLASSSGVVVHASEPALSKKLLAAALLVAAVSSSFRRATTGAGVPAGTHEVLVSYIGLDSVRAQVTVSPGQRAVRDFDLTTGVYKLEAFKVSGEREGGAAAITAQRNAPNHTNVVSMDSFGNLPNMSAGELAIRLPGVAAGLDDEGNVTGLIIRGQGAINNR
eukprot:gene42143-55959_t